MKIARVLTVFSLLLLALAVPAAAQRKRPTAKPTPRPTPRMVKTIVNADLAAAKEKVSNQLFNVNEFVNRLGPIAQTIEANDSQPRSRRLSKAQRDANEANKQKVITAIRNLRSGLVVLETDFRTKPVLNKYLIKIQGISDLCARSEDSALAGRFVASKDPLRQVAQKLSDTMAVMQ